MESLILLLLALISNRANAQRFKGIDPDLIVNPPEGLDLEGCFIDLVKSDIDGSGAIEKDEYLNFINTYGERICWYQEELTLEQHGAFNSLACICRSQEGNDASCCLLDKARLPTTNAMNPQARTKEQLLFLTVTCVVTDGTLEHLCMPQEIEPAMKPTFAPTFLVHPTTSKILSISSPVTSGASRFGAVALFAVWVMVGYLAALTLPF